MIRNIYTTNVNYKLTREGGLENTYKTMNYKELKNKSIGEVSR